MNLIEALKTGHRIRRVYEGGQKGPWIDTDEPALYWSDDIVKGNYEVEPQRFEFKGYFSTAGELFPVKSEDASTMDKVPINKTLKFTVEVIDE